MGDAVGDAEGAMGTVAAILALAAQAAALIAELINLIRNDDDLVCKREFGFVTEGVDFFFNYSDWELPMGFDGAGMGKHTLYLRRKVDSCTQDMGRLMYSKLTGNSWGSPYGGQGRTAHSVAMLTYRGELWSFFARSIDGMFGVSRWANNQWQPVQWIDYIAMRYRPSVVVFKDRIWLDCVSRHRLALSIRSLPVPDTKPGKDGALLCVK